MAKSFLIQTNLDYLLFPVELRNNPRKTNREYSKVVTGIIDGNEIDLNYCSPVYELVPNSEIFPKIEEIFRSKGIDFIVNYYHINHVRFYAKYVITDKRFEYRVKGTNDIINFSFDFQHSYNGLTKYKGVAGYYRLVCNNGLTIPVEEMYKYNLSIEGKHTMSIVRSLQQFDALFEQLINNFDTVNKAITDKYERLGGIWVSKPEDRIKEVLKAVNITAVENSKFNTVQNILDRINKEANINGLGYNGKVNDWLIYNGINQYINDNSLNIAVPEKRRDTDTKVLEFMLA